MNTSPYASVFEIPSREWWRSMLDPDDPYYERALAEFDRLRATAMLALNKGRTPTGREGPGSSASSGQRDAKESLPKEDPLET